MEQNGDVKGTGERGNVDVVGILAIGTLAKRPSLIGKAINSSNPLKLEALYFPNSDKIILK
jgi:hypothetical protein